MRYIDPTGKDDTPIGYDPEPKSPPPDPKDPNVQADDIEQKNIEAKLPAHMVYMPRPSTPAVALRTWAVCSLRETLRDGFSSIRN